MKDTLHRFPRTSLPTSGTARVPKVRCASDASPRRVICTETIIRSVPQRPCHGRRRCCSNLHRQPTRLKSGEDLLHGRGEMGNLAFDLLLPCLIIGAVVRVRGSKVCQYSRRRNQFNRLT